MRFQLIDESNIGDHSHLDAGDKCCYMFEYTSGKDYSFSSTNSLISNLKKKPIEKFTNPRAYKFKGQDISKCSAWLSQAINPKWLQIATLVPIPPSKEKTDPEYDDRMVQICKGIDASFTVDVRELVLQRASIPAAHENPKYRPSIDEFVDLYTINEDATEPPPSTIGIVDDVLTAGTHFKAMKRVLENRFPNVSIFGLLIARRVFPDDETPDIQAN